MTFKTLFEPRTMAVIGVSTGNDRHPANVIYNKNHLRYPVRVFPVNPRGGDLQGEKVYAGIKEIPERVDLAVIAFSDLVMGLEDEIESIDLNPVKCSRERCVVADARIILKQERSRKRANL
ncbi:MAG: CoA-binding protein [Pseudomonadota bacterium]